MITDYKNWEKEFTNFSKEIEGEPKIKKSNVLGTEFDIYTSVVNVPFKKGNIRILQNADECGSDEVNINGFLTCEFEIQNRSSLKLSIYKRDFFDKIFPVKRALTRDDKFDKIFNLKCSDDRVAVKIFSSANVRNEFLNNNLTFNINTVKGITRIRLRNLATGFYSKEILNKYYNLFIEILEKIPIH